jgi:hypothetical protein
MLRGLRSMNNADLLKEIQALREGQDKLLALVEAKGLTESTPAIPPGEDLGRIYRTQGRTSFREALREQNKLRTAAYQKRGLAI